MRGWGFQFSEEADDELQVIDDSSTAAFPGAQMRGTGAPSEEEGFAN